MVWQYCWNAWATTLRLRRLVLLLWVINVLISATFMAPILVGLKTGLESSPIAWSLLDDSHQATLIDVANLVSRVLRDAGPGMAAGLALGLLLNVVTLGGIYGRLLAHKQGGDGQPLLQGFMRDCGQHFTRSLSLVFWGGLASGLCFLPVAGLRMAIERHENFTLSEHSVVWIRLLGWGAVLVWLVLTRLLLDLARAHLFVQGGPGALRSLWLAMQVLKQYPWRAFFSYTGVILMFAVLSWGLLAVRLWMPEQSMVAVVLAGVLGQLAVFFRISSRVAAASVSRAFVE